MMGAGPEAGLGVSCCCFLVRVSMTAEARGAIIAAVAVLESHMLRKAVTERKPVGGRGRG